MTKHDAQSPTSRVNNDFASYVAGQARWFDLQRERLGGMPLGLKAELLDLIDLPDGSERHWWQFTLTSGNVSLCEVRVYDAALALPLLIAVVKDAFPNPVSSTPTAWCAGSTPSKQQQALRYLACEDLREIFRAPGSSARSPSATGSTSRMFDTTKSKPDPEPA